MCKTTYYMEFNNDTGVVNPEIKFASYSNVEKLFNVLTSIPEEIPSYKKEYIPTSKAVKDYVDAHSGAPENMVTTDTTQTIAGTKTIKNLIVPFADDASFKLGSSSVPNVS